MAAGDLALGNARKIQLRMPTFASAVGLVANRPTASLSPGIERHHRTATSNGDTVGPAGNEGNQPPGLVIFGSRLSVKRNVVCCVVVVPSLLTTRSTLTVSPLFASSEML